MNLLAPEMLPYSVSILIFAIFALLEVLSFLLGWGIFSFLDDLFDVEHSDIELDNSTTLGGLFSYLNPQRVPFSMVILSFFFLFGFLGHLLQKIVGLFPLWITLPVTLLLSLVLLRHITGFIGRVLPRETSEVVSVESFIGKQAMILDPVSQKELPARAKLKDAYGAIHYIRVEPFHEEDKFYEGDQVIVLEKRESIFLVEKALM